MKQASKIQTSFKGSIGYKKKWLRGDENTDADGGAHVHEGLRLQDKSGWVGIGETNILGVGDKTTKVTTNFEHIFHTYSRLSNKRAARLFISGGFFLPTRPY